MFQGSERPLQSNGKSIWKNKMYRVSPKNPEQWESKRFMRNEGNRLINI